MFSGARRVEGSLDIRLPPPLAPVARTVRDVQAGLGAFKLEYATKPRARGFLLPTHDGSDTWFHRKSTGATQIRNSAMTIYGCTQPARLAKFKDLEDDGLLQRFLLSVPATIRGGSRPDVQVSGVDKLEAAISDLVHQGSMRYRLTRAGAAMVQETERLGENLVHLSEAGIRFPAWARKMHGQHARLTLVLHLMEAPKQVEVADDVVARAGRLMKD